MVRQFSAALYKTVHLHVSFLYRCISLYVCICLCESGVILMFVCVCSWRKQHHS